MAGNAIHLPGEGESVRFLGGYISIVGGINHIHSEGVAVELDAASAVELAAELCAWAKTRLAIEASKR